MKKILTTLILFSSFLLFGQNEPQFTQIQGNELVINPGAIGNKNRINASLIARKQWMGFEGSPTSQLLIGDTYLGAKKGGVGLSLYNDKVGFENTVNFRAMYAFPVNLSSSLVFTPGLGIGIINKTIQGSKLIYEDSDDQSALYNNVSHFMPDFTFGCELNSADGYTLGISSIHLNKSNKGSSAIDNPRHYYFYGNYIIPVNDKISIIPYLLVKSTMFSTQYEINTTGTFDRELWWLGLGYRQQDAITFSLGLNLEKTGWIDENVRIGYAYDVGVGAIRSYNGGSHEIVISATFKGFDKGRVKPESPRRFRSGG